MEQRLTHWWHGWFSGDGLLELQLHASPLLPAHLSGLEWHSLRHEDQQLMLGAPVGVCDEFAARALCMPDDEPSTFTHDVAMACRDDLVASLWGEGPHSFLPRDERPALWQLDPRHGGLLFQLKGLSGTAWIWMNQGWCEAHGPEPATRTSSVLSDRRAAIGGSALRLSAHIDLGQITLADSLGWSVGEVLLTDIPRNANVALSVNKTFVTNGVLGQAGANRHVTIT
ncbi:FliM/FliN family flagellar motor switch protein [Pseudoxanthomonas sp. PXM02]|uniref:FliM/FliN family flagellar motor switch protein n=1 Tax=Pseudoxanthomonas sp. PXM02 TaxID=2769294 RepID=UPI00177C8BD2|nr:FliM/FliN family flagellar motor switch protein [Pseudoxanthomonas sp. PXM02]MBD9477414.1 FliM/FliN family flagellar motor switch protein [Pseudoxanthomonas sp. PXM02]